MLSLANHRSYGCADANHAVPLDIATVFDTSGGLGLRHGSPSNGCPHADSHAHRVSHARADLPPDARGIPSSHYHAGANHDYGATATPTSTPQPSEAIAALGWVRDGLTPTETLFVEQLELASATSDRYFQALIDAPWVTDKRGAHVWGNFVGALNELAAMDENASLRIMELELTDTVDYSDVAAIEFMFSLVALDSGGVNRLLVNTSVEESARDGPDGFLQILYLDMHNPDAASLVKAQPWVQDGLGYGDESFIAELARLARLSPQVLQAVLREERDWLPPGPGAVEYPESLGLIVSVAIVDEKEALRIIDIPLSGAHGEAGLLRAGKAGGSGRIQPSAAARCDGASRGDLQRWGDLQHHHSHP